MQTRDFFATCVGVNAAAGPIAIYGYSVEPTAWSAAGLIVCVLTFTVPVTCYVTVIVRPVITANRPFPGPEPSRPARKTQEPIVHIPAMSFRLRPVAVETAPAFIADVPAACCTPVGHASTSPDVEQQSPQSPSGASQAKE